MKLLIYSRPDLLEALPPAEDPPAEDRALLLEGSWPEDARREVRRSLDEAIDGRFDWIDRQAADWAELLGETPSRDEVGQSPLSSISLAYLNALNLRYYLVKLLRPPAYLAEVQSLRRGDRIELIAADGRDEDYTRVLSQFCRARGVHFGVRWIRGQRRRPGRFPPNPPWRRWAGRLSRLVRPAADRGGSRPRVVLCGNPRLLDPVCRELAARRCDLWWLCDRFAVKSWLHWQATGTGQLVCDSSLAVENHLATGCAATGATGPLEFLGVDFSGPVGRWLAERAATHGPRQTRLVEQIDAHFRRVHPDVVVLDEDATPMARAAVAIGRLHGARSLVVQHGVPCCRFGFSPLAADRILVWGRSSQEQLVDWGVPPERIQMTGLPRHEHRCTGNGADHSSPDKSHAARLTVAHGRRGTVRVEQIRPPRILLLATVPPRDDRPDAVSLHLTAATHAQMLRTAFAAVAGICGVELIVKLHPRATDDPVVPAVLAEFPTLRSRVVCGGVLETRLEGIDCVLSCGSSAGVEATIFGTPVIQLVPPGATGFPRHDGWGMAGTARNESELQRLLARVLVEGWRPAAGLDPNVFADLGQSAAARIADAVLAPFDSVPKAPHVEFVANHRPPPYFFNGLLTVAGTAAPKPTSQGHVHPRRNASR